jgi:tRNA threonylcarbamoyladenosine biosynthesis protein TsaB
MRRLVIDTATPMLSVALFEDDRVLAHHHALVGRGHAELLIPVIAALPDGGRADAIAVGCGPGSFTGTRIAIAAAKALALAWGSAIDGFDTLALIAAAARTAHDVVDDNIVAVAVDGGHGEWLVSDQSGQSQTLAPAEAAANVTAQTIVGARAADLVALRGWGVALDATADARAWIAIDAAGHIQQVAPVYARPPDARLPDARAPVVPRDDLGRR